MQHLNHTTPEEVVTRRSAGFYFGIALAILFLGGLAVLSYRFAIHIGSWGPALLVIPLLIAVPYVVVASYHTTPIVRISSDGITYKGQYYTWEHVNRVELTGSKTVKMAAARPIEGTRIVLNSGEEISLLMASYSNLAEVRRFLVNVPALQKDVLVGGQDIGSIGLTATQGDINEVYWVKGNSILNICGLLSCMFAIPVLAVLIFGKDSRSVFWVLVLALASFTFFTAQINYFGVSRQRIIVRNVFRPWKRKEYAMAGIRQIIFTHLKGTAVMRIIFRDFSAKQIVAAGLRNKDWFALLGLLRSRGIEVVDELNFTERVKW